MSIVNILGIGSAFGDDQVGWLAIDSLQKQLIAKAFPKNAICLMKYDRPDFNILPAMLGVKYIYLIDAVMTGKAPAGTLWQFKQAEIINANGLISTHGISMADILAIGKNLYKLPENIEYFGIEIILFNKFAKVSPQILQAIGQLTDYLVMQIDAILSKEI